MGLESLKRLYICVSDTKMFGDVLPTVHVMVLQTLQITVVHKHATFCGGQDNARH